MELRNDPFAQTLGIKLVRRTDTGVVTAAVIGEKHLNPYDIAHGGVAYTMGCVTAQWSAAVCLEREMEVDSVSSQYLAPLVLGGAECESRLLFSDEDHCTYAVSVRNERGQHCFSQLVTLRPQRAERPVNTVFSRTIFPATEQAEPNAITGLRFPLRSPGPFCDLTQVYILDCGADFASVGADILPETGDDCGAAHCGLVYACCDTGVGVASSMWGSLAVTVSSSMNYFRPAQTGPVRVTVQRIREGHTILYYQVLAVDGMGAPAAVGQFCLHPKQELNGLAEKIKAQL